MLVIERVTFAFPSLIYAEPLGLVDDIFADRDVPGCGFLTKTTLAIWTLDLRVHGGPHYEGFSFGLSFAL